ncbi:MAG: protease modulator HflK [Clostridia bacterium]|nr:protease modulator HflK [Clostridia bacterium]
MTGTPKKERNDKRSLFGDILESMVKAFRWIVLVVLAAILCSGIKSVQTGEVAIILRFGKLLGETRTEQVHEPGLLFAFPYIIDEVITVPTGKVFELTVDTHNSQDYMSTDIRQNGYIITGDQNIALVGASVKYTITDPVAYALSTADVITTLHGLVSGALAVGGVDISIDDLLTTEKDAYAKSVMEEAQKRIDALELGVTISSLELKTVSPPLEVNPIFQAVNSASVQAQTLVAEARQYYEVKIPTAQANAQALVSAAQADYASQVAAANDTLSEFRGLLEEYNTNPDVVMTRVYSQKLTQILSSIGTIHLLEPGESVPNVFVP